MQLTVKNSEGSRCSLLLQYTGAAAAAGMYTYAGCNSATIQLKLAK